VAVEVVLAVMAICGFAAFGQTVAGFGFSLLAVAPLGMVIDPKDAIAVSLVLLIANSAMLVWGERAHIAWDAVGALLVGAVPGLPLGLAVISVAPVRGLRIALAVAVLSAVAFLASGFELSHRSRMVEWVGGFFCGIFTTSLNTNGPPAVLALQARSMPPEQFRPTTSAVLGLTSLVGAVMFGFAGRLNVEVGQACVVALPAMLVGWQVGMRLRQRVSTTAFRTLIMLLLVVAAVLTLIAAFS
jgi:uncharacterized membrane protein YfcA